MGGISAYILRFPHGTKTVVCGGGFNKLQLWFPCLLARNIGDTSQNTPARTNSLLNEALEPELNLEARGRYSGQPCSEVETEGINCIPGLPGGADSRARGASTIYSESLVATEAGAFIRINNPQAILPHPSSSFNPTFSSAIMTLLRLIPHKSSNTFSIVNASPSQSTTKTNNTTSSNKNSNSSNATHTPSDASLLFRLAHDLHPVDVSCPQPPRRESPPTNHHNHRHPQQSHHRQHNHHMLPNDSSVPSPFSRPHAPFNPATSTPSPRRLPRRTAVVPGRSLLQGEPLSQEKPLLQGTQPSPQATPAATPSHSNHPRRRHEAHAPQEPLQTTPRPMPVVPAQVEEAAGGQEEDVAVVDPQRPGLPPAVDDGEILHAYDVGVCAAVRSMAAYWAARASERHVSNSERRIFRREAERLRGLV
ncbi:hypothetical protein QBC39DRAFT_429803, partial [Podospora conica]